jgi:hypothetical protein|tara:strand:+ start:51 stop:299 length:249 start_codon:yes stop_codon:yes gene_type:complete
MTYSIEGIPATQTELVRAVQSLAASAMGIEQHLDKIHDRLDGIEDSFIGLSVTVRGFEEMKGFVEDLKPRLENIHDAIDRKP